MPLFDNILSEGETLFRNEDTLEFDYLPSLLPYRENQQQYIAECIKPLAQGRQGKNLLVSGAPGIGKTSCVRFVFRELEEKTSDIRPLFVNCWKKQTTNQVLTEMAKQLGVTGSQFRNNEELWGKIEEALPRFKGVAIALDEVDAANDYDFLYQIAENIPRFTLLMITNEEDFLASMDARIRSRLVIEGVQFPAYKRAEVEGILRERMRVAFHPGVWGREAFQMVVDRCYEKGDIRVGLIMMREAGRNAEKSASKRITVEHVIECKAKIVDPERMELDERAKCIVNVIRNNPGIESGHLSELVRKEGLRIPDSTLRRIIQKLDRDGVIFRQPAQTDHGGQTMKHFVDE